MLRALCVSIHDVAPATWTDCRRVIAAVHAVAPIPLTLLVVPTFYDSIEIARDRMFAKFNRRAERQFVGLAFLLTFIEAILTLLLVRFVFRMILKGSGWVIRLVRGRPNPVM